MPDLKDTLSDMDQLAGADAATIVEQIVTAPNQDVPNQFVAIGDDLEEARAAIAADPSLEGSSLENYVRRTEEAMNLAFQAEQMEINMAEGGEGLMETLQAVITALNTGDWGAVSGKLMNLFNTSSAATPEDVENLKQRAAEMAENAVEDLEQAEQDGLVNNGTGGPDIDKDLVTESVRSIDALKL